MAKRELEKIKTPEFRVSFPKVFKAVPYKPGDTPKYSITMLFDSKAQATPEFKRMKGAAKAAFVKEFGQAEWDNTPKDWFQWPIGYNNPFKKPDAKMVEKYDGYDEDTVYFQSSTQYKFPVVDENVQEIISEDVFYAGCYAWAYIAPYGYVSGANKGVTSYLQGVQKTRDGETFAATARAEDMFAKVANNSGEGAADENYDF